MNIALVDNGQVTAVGDYRALFPQTSFSPSGPSDEFLAAKGAMKVNTWLPHNAATEKIVACPPYVNGPWVYTVQVAPLTQDDIAARNATQAATVRAQRNSLLTACDWTQLGDSPVDVAKWRLYRKDLRNLPQQAGFPWSVTWPVEPDSAST